MKNYQEKIPEKVKHFCKEVPVVKKQINYGSLERCKGLSNAHFTNNKLLGTYHKTPIFGDKSSIARINP